MAQVTGLFLTSLIFPGYFRRIYRARMWRTAAAYAHPLTYQSGNSLPSESPATGVGAGQPGLDFGAIRYALRTSVGHTEAGRT